MKIGIIGAGHIGSVLARRFTELGHEVSIANSRGPDTLADVATQTGATAVTAEQAAHADDVVVVTIPMRNVPDLGIGLFEGVPESVVVIDTCNYYPQQRDGRIDGIELGLAESRWVAQQLGRPVVKAFNNIYADHLGTKGKPSGSSDRIALPYAGDDDAAKSRVAGLIDELGFDPVDDGTLEESWRQQPGSLVYGTDYDTLGVRKALEAASPQRKPEWKATSDSPGTLDKPA
ncbi:MAG: NAD(P)-binding domain-containing protein [Pseudomonadota bacterium]|nr:NAD(P)-binding domain-containing protein [Pseudomonadota bacterium]